MKLTLNRTECAGLRTSTQKHWDGYKFAESVKVFFAGGHCLIFCRNESDASSLNDFIHLSTRDAKNESESIVIDISSGIASVNFVHDDGSERTVSQETTNEADT